MQYVQMSNVIDTSMLILTCLQNLKGQWLQGMIFIASEAYYRPIINIQDIILAPYIKDDRLKNLNQGLLIPTYTHKGCVPASS